MVRFRLFRPFLRPWMAWLALTAMCAAGGWAQVASHPAASAAAGPQLALQLGESLQSLQGAIAGITPAQLHVPRHAKQAIAEAQTSLQRNLQQAVPGLIAAFRSQPENLGAAFRLYRDTEAVLAVARRAAGAMPPKDDAAGGAALRQATDGVSANLDQLAAWIEQRGQADYAARQTASAPAPTPAAAAPPPATLVIQDANTAAKPAAKKKAKKAEKKKSPGPGGSNRPR